MEKFIKRIINAQLWKRLKLAAASQFGYVVIGQHYNAYHACFSYDEAIEWMRCYENCDLLFKGTLLMRYQIFVMEQPH